MDVSLQPFALPERYRIERGIAAGGMASVYAAHDTVLDRPVAVKVLADHLNDDVTARARFEREARAAASVSDHPGVVTIFDVGEFNGRAFIVMERRDGGTIADAGPPGEERAMCWLQLIADALDAAHARGIVHRDIKPGNLLLDDRGNVGVADFGIASLMHETERFTMTGEVLGTAAYLSPEQAAGESATAASDRYALAVVAYELLTGSKPFVASGFAAVARAHIEDPPPPAPGLPPAAQAVLERGLDKTPENRWPSARAFVDALGEALATATVATAAQPPEPTAATRPIPPRVPQQPQKPPRSPKPAKAARPRRSGTVLVAIAAALTIAAGVAIALGGGGDDDPTTRAQGDATPTAEVEDDATPKKEKKVKEKDAAEPTAEPIETTAAAPVAAEEETAAPDTSSEDLGDPAELNAAGFELFEAGDYAGAIPSLEQAVAACGDSTLLDPCGYALYNLGASLNRAGRPDEAIPILEDRLARFGDNSAGEVQAELDDALANAG